MQASVVSHIVSFFACGVCLGVVESTIHSAPVAVSAANPAHTPEGLSSSDWSGIRAVFESGRHAIAANRGGGFQARNPGQEWLTRFDDRGFRVTPDHGEWQWGLELTGFGERTISTASPEPRIQGSRISYQRDEGIEEWFLNGTRGLEQGWTLQNPGNWAGADPHALPLYFKIRGGLRPRISKDRSGIAFQCAATDTTVLTYSGLKAWDAEHTPLNVRFAPGVDDATFAILVDVERAVYPITIDPVAQQAYLKASNTGAFDGFGYAVAVSGDTVVVGAYGEDSSATGVGGNQSDNSLASAGAAYVFVRTGTAWTQQAYLKASNTGQDWFGYAVAISGDTVVVGAPYEASATGSQGNNDAFQSGAAYVFVRNGTTWTQQAYLKASTIETGDRFGSAVAVSGDTVLVGAYLEASAATGVDGNQANNSAAQSGAAYVFVRNGSTWNQQAYLKASNTAQSDYFGFSVAVSENTAVVGAYGEDSAAMGVGGNQSSNTVGQSGAAYIFARNGTAWSQQAYLKASNTGFSDVFGYSVAVSGDTVLVGAPQESSSAMGVGGNQTNDNVPDSGAAYVFVRNGSTWSQQAYLKASNTGASDFFGYSVAVSGSAAVVGAYGEDSNAIGVGGNQTNNNAAQSGAAFVFVSSGTTWSQRAYLKASNTGVEDVFGNAVSVSGNTVVAGAYLEDSSATGVNGLQSSNSAADSGAAYVFDLDASIVITESFLSGSSFTIRFTSAPGVKGWKVSGSTDLLSFPENKTSASVITETSPGKYQAVVNVSGEPSTYFLRIEKLW